MKTISSVLFLVAVLAVLSSATITMTTPVQATAGMGNCKNDPDPEACTPQKDRVGNDNAEVDRDGPGGDDGTPGEEDDDPNTPQNDEANCWGKVSSELGKIQDHPAHASDPVPGDSDNETPREGVGNQDEGHPSDHADTVGGLGGIDVDCDDD